MASYTIDYSKFDHNPALKRREALKGIENYLGKAKMKKISDDVVRDNAARRGFIFSLGMFVGISGFPAEAWADSLGLVDKVSPMDQMVDATVGYLFSVEKDCMGTDEALDPEHIDAKFVLDRIEAEGDFLTDVAEKLKTLVMKAQEAAKVASNQGDSAS